MRSALDHGLLLFAVLVFCGPVVWLLSDALAPGTIMENWRALTSALAPSGGTPGLSRMVCTSLALALAVAVLSTVLSFLAAYAFVFFRAPLLTLAFWAAVSTLYFPIEARMLQTFDVAATLGLTGSFLGLALPVLQLALGTLFFRQHFRRLPPQLLEAARLDGAGPFRCLLDIVLPLSRPQVATVALVTFLWGWNQYLWPLMISVDDRHWTLMRALERVGAGSGAGLTLAALALLPPLLLVLVLARTLARMGRVRVEGRETVN